MPAKKKTPLSKKAKAAVKAVKSQIKKKAKK